MNQFSIRPLSISDANRMIEWMHNEEVTRYLKLHGATASFEDAISFIENAKDESANIHRAIVDQNDIYLGTVSLKNIDLIKKEAEYAIAMHPDGIGTGASKAGTELILKLAFEDLKLNRIYLNVLSDNVRAVKFYYKLGFVLYDKTKISFKGKEKVLLWFEKIKQQNPDNSTCC
jgi:diamine N-acetyltransferase